MQKVENIANSLQEIPYFLSAVTLTSQLFLMQKEWKE